MFSSGSIVYDSTLHFDHEKPVSLTTPVNEHNGDFISHSHRMCCIGKLPQEQWLRGRQSAVAHSTSFSNLESLSESLALPCSARSSTRLMRTHAGCLLRTP